MASRRAEPRGAGKCVKPTTDEKAGVRTPRRSVAVTSPEWQAGRLRSGGAIPSRRWNTAQGCATEANMRRRGNRDSQAQSRPGIAAHPMSREGDPESIGASNCSRRLARLPPTLHERCCTFRVLPRNPIQNGAEPANEKIRLDRKSVNRPDEDATQFRPQPCPHVGLLTHWPRPGVTSPSAPPRTAGFPPTRRRGGRRPHRRGRKPQSN